MRMIWVFGLLMFATLVRADYVEPARGSETRKALMDALRPHAEWELGRPGAVRGAGFAAGPGTGIALSGRLCRGGRAAPGGKKIDIRQTPGFVRGHLDPEYMDGTSLQALYRKVGNTWVAVHWAVGATDVWYAAPIFCEEYFAVIPEYCAG